MKTVKSNGENKNVENKNVENKNVEKSKEERDDSVDSSASKSQNETVKKSESPDPVTNPEPSSTTTSASTDAEMTEQISSTTTDVVQEEVSTEVVEPMEQVDAALTTKENDVSPTSSSCNKRPLNESSDQNVESEIAKSTEDVSGAKKLRLETDSA